MLRQAAQDDAARLREWRRDDILELEALEGPMTPEGREEHLRAAIEQSSPAVAWEESGEVLAVGGVVPLAESDGGVSWIVSSPAAHEHPRDFLRVVLEILDSVLMHYPALVVLAGSWLGNHHRWLERLGFRVGGSLEMNPGITLFVRGAT
ncbi:MAG TPA: hypothetical protein VJ997_09255 [Longimicrobiales bacterium]|nr:hypothetical protein [Longimicrobiales bacterium]